jgi:hypothetical protein
MFFLFLWFFYPMHQRSPKVVLGMEGAGLCECARATSHYISNGVLQ